MARKNKGRRDDGPSAQWNVKIRLRGWFNNETGISTRNHPRQRTKREMREKAGVESDEGGEQMGMDRKEERKDEKGMKRETGGRREEMKKRKERERERKEDEERKKRVTAAIVDTLFSVSRRKKSKFLFPAYTTRLFWMMVYYSIIPF